MSLKTSGERRYLGFLKVESYHVLSPDNVLGALYVSSNLFLTMALFIVKTNWIIAKNIQYNNIIDLYSMIRLVIFANI